ncbi:hypothetical protein C0989_004726 [Termitomyces sp. Mn162]|nr:hypothetical protein C0989_004726 [Termitomyces sp. Mn162]
MCQGFVLLNKKDAPIQDAFHQGLGYAMQWYNNLRICLKHHVNAAILKANSQIQEYTNPNLNSEASIKDEDAIIPDHSISIPSSSINEPSPSRVVMLPRECGHLLQQRCPACFGGNFFGCSLEEDGGDIQVCVDGNFNHQHFWSAGDCPNFYNPVYILSKNYVNDVRAHIETLQKTPKPHQHKTVVPDKAVNECESSHTAGSGSNVKTNMEKFDNANIDTPGEQQKYAIALIEHLFFLLPQAATVMVLYDVACILDHSLHVEESHCLQVESANIVHWFGHKLSAIELALSELCNACLHIPLQQHHAHVLSFRAQWTSPIASQDVFDNQIHAAGELVWSMQASPILTPVHGPHESLEQQAEYIDNNDNDDVLKLESSDAFELFGDGGPTNPKDILLLDYIFQELSQDTAEDAESIVPFVVAPGVNVTLVWELPVSIDIFVGQYQLMASFL